MARKVDLLKKAAAFFAAHKPSIFLRLATEEQIELLEVRRSLLTEPTPNPELDPSPSLNKPSIFLRLATEEQIELL